MTTETLQDVTALTITNQPSNQNEPLTAGQSNSEDDAPPVDALRDAGLLEAEPMEEGPEAEEVGPDGTVIINKKVFVSEDTFYEMFIQAHVLGGFLFQLKTLLMAGNIEATRPASNELYSLILEQDKDGNFKYKFLHFIVQPQSKYYKMIAVFGAYGLAIVPPVLAEIAAKKEARQKAQGKTETAANDNEPTPENEAA